MNVGSLYTILIQNITFFFNQSTGYIVWGLFALGGWVILAAILLFAFTIFWADWREEKETTNWKYVLLAVDVPQENLQSPKAIEQLFSHLIGGYEKPSIIEKFWHGHKQRWFSFEIISIEGYIQFLIWTEQKFQDLIEASFYAQYPQAEITEVDDYVNAMPTHFPDDTYDMWGADFTLAEHDAYPIRVYEEFKNSIGKDFPLSDPMGSFLESFSHIGTGEQIWFQIILKPVSQNWKEKAIDKIKELIGEKIESKKTIADYIIKVLLGGMVSIGDQIFNREAVVSKEEGKPDAKNNLLFLTPGQKKLVESMENKISKVGFKTKIRVLYIAKKEVFHKERASYLLVGAMQQYNNPTSNSIIPKITTIQHSIKKSNRRKSELIKAFQRRNIKYGAKAFMFNIEELATIWHFPMSHVQTPQLQKTVGKQAAPPSGLPVEDLPVETTEKKVDDSANLKSSLPGYQTDSGHKINIDTDFG